MKDLIESLETRKQYIEEYYNLNNRKIALFEVETLLKIVNKHSGKKPKRIRSNRKTKGFFN
jgi:DNA-binding transcriptional regulator GbsR (MarR family)